MRSFFVLAVAGVAVALSATATQAATLNFTGNTTTADLPFAANGTFSLSVTYVESVAGNSSSASASTFSVGADAGGTLAYSKPGAQQVLLSFGKSGSNDTLSINGNYRPVGGGNLANLSLVFTRAEVSGLTLDMTAANVAAILTNPTTYSGTFIQLDANDNPLYTAVLGGTIPVPEPGSISLLAGLGLVCGRRVWRRRQQKQAAAV